MNDTKYMMQQDTKNIKKIRTKLRSTDYEGQLNITIYIIIHYLCFSKILQLKRSTKPHGLHHQIL